MAVKVLRAFLRPYKSTRHDAPNWGSLRGGLWKIPLHKKAVFFKLYGEQFQSFTENTNMGFVFRPPHVKLQPFLVDLDFQTSDKQNLDIKACARFAKVVAKQLQTSLNQHITYVIIAKPTGYWCTLKKTDSRVWKTGCHIYYVNTSIDLATSRDFRLFCLKHVREHFGHMNFLNSIEDVVDSRIPHRENGLMCCGDYKPGGKGGRYCVKVAASLSGEKSIEDFISHERFLKEFSNYMDDIYGWVFARAEENWHPEVPIPKKAPKKPVASPRKKQQNKDITFKLDEFLLATKGWVPSEESYKQICMYMSNQGLHAEECNKLCNSAWGYTTSETRQMIRNYDGAMVNRASMIRLLTLHATTEWDERAIFIQPKPSNFTTFNDILDVRNHVWSDEDLNAIFRNVFIQTWGENDQRIFYKEVAVENAGNMNLLVTKWVIATGSPFFKAYDRYVHKTVSKEEMVEYLDELKPNQKMSPAQMKNFFKVIEDLKTLPTNQLLEKVQLRGMKVKRKVKLSSEFEKSLLNDNLTTFRTFDSVPFLYEDNTPCDTLNIWQRNALLDHEYTKPVDLTKSRTWFWFHTILCNDEPHKVEWMTQYHHEKVCHASRKIEKLLLFFSEETATGKSSHQHFFASIMGNHTCIKFDDVNMLLKEKNAELLNRLMVYFDDSQRLKQAECEKIKTKVTERYYSYRRMYENAVKMKANHDYVLTTNKRNCFHISRQNRRIEIVDVNPVMSKCNSEQFWNEYYAERNDPDHCKAWLDYFIDFKSDLDVRSKYCRFSTEDLEIEKEASLKVSHRFLTELFSTRNFHEMAADSRRKDDDQYRLEYFSNFILDKDNFTVEHKFLWKMFESWKKREGEQIFMKRRTFDLQLTGLGFKKRQVRLRGQPRQYCFKLNPKEILKEIKDHYNFKETIPVVQDEVFILPETTDCQNAFERLLTAEVLVENEKENIERRAILTNIDESRWFVF